MEFREGPEERARPSCHPLAEKEERAESPLGEAKASVAKVDQD